jgi:hypothetical protein
VLGIQLKHGVVPLCGRVRLEQLPFDHAGSAETQLGARHLVGLDRGTAIEDLDELRPHLLAQVDIVERG